MFAIFIIFISLTLSLLGAWIIDNGGNVIIHFMNFEIQTNILTFIILSFLTVILTFSISYILGRILSLKFPNLLKIYQRKAHIKNIENKLNKLQKSQEENLKIISETLEELIIKDEELAKYLYKKFLKNSENKELKNLLENHKKFEGEFFENLKNRFIKNNT
jgi:ABC-type multidrug transport system fused ATPase/permease subunit